MIYYLSLMLLFVLQPTGFIYSYEDWHRYSDNSTVDLNHKDWDSLLQKYVNEDGNVDYEGFKKEKVTLSRYLKYLAENAPEESAKREEKLTYYINLYNAATVKLILENYPIASIKEIKNPWNRKWVKVGDRTISLGHIEHKILRKLNEPRIHFAINCASYSCPKLSRRAYTLDKLESQLESATIDFVNDNKRNRISRDNVAISEIFKWYKSDFTEDGDLIDYINRYSKITIAKGTKLQYIKYDWGLNEIK